MPGTITSLGCWWHKTTYPTYISKQPTSQNNQCNTTSSKYPTATNPYNSTQPNPRQTTRSTRSPPEFLSFQIQSAVQGLGLGLGFFHLWGGKLPVFGWKKRFGVQKKPGPIVTMVLNPLQKKSRTEKKIHSLKTNGFDALPLNFLNGWRFVQIPGWEFHLFSGLWWEVLGHRTRPSWIWSWRAAAAPPCRSQQITHKKKNGVKICRYVYNCRYWYDMYA